MKLHTTYIITCSIILLSTPEIRSSAKSNKRQLEQENTASATLQTNPSRLKRHRPNPNEEAASSPAGHSEAEKTSYACNESTEKLKKIIARISDSDYQTAAWKSIALEAEQLLDDADLTVAAGKNQDTILHIAARSQIFPFITAIIRKNPELTSVANSQGKTALFMALENQTEKTTSMIIKKLIEKTPVGALNRKADSQDAAVHLAIRRSMPAAVRDLTLKSADFLQTDKDGKSCLELAQANSGKEIVDSVEKIIETQRAEKGAAASPTNAPVHLGATAATSAAASSPTLVSTISSAKATELLRFYLQQVIKNKYTVKQYAEFENILYAIDAGANIEIRVGKLEETVMHILARASNKKDFLAALHPRIKPALYVAKNKLGQTPLQVAIIAHTLPGPIIEFLLDTAAVDAIDHAGLTALHYAILNKSMVALKKLASFGADPNIGKKWRDVLEQSDAKNKLEIEEMLVRQEIKLARRAKAHARKVNSSTEAAIAYSDSGKYAVAASAASVVDGTLKTSVAAATPAVMAMTAAAASAAPVNFTTELSLASSAMQEIANILLETLISEAAESTPQTRRHALQADILPLVPNLLTTGKDKKTILHLLAYDGDRETARELKKFNETQFQQLVHRKDNNGESPFDIALKKADVQFIQLLIGIKSNAPLTKSDLLITIAARAKDPVWQQTLEALYTSGAVDIQNIELQKKLYTTMINSMGKEKAFILAAAWLKKKLGAAPSMLVKQEARASL